MSIEFNINEKSKITIPGNLPVVALQDNVIVPLAVTPIVLTDEKYIQAVNEIKGRPKLVFIITRRSFGKQYPNQKDLFEIGTVAQVHRIIFSSRESSTLIVQGLERYKLVQLSQSTPYFRADILPAPELKETGLEVEALRRLLSEVFEKLVALIPELPIDLAMAIMNLKDPLQFAYLVASATPIDYLSKQEILEKDSVSEKMRILTKSLQQELAVLELQKDIADQTQEKISKSQRDFMLREQIRTLQKELGEEQVEDIDLIRQKLEAAKLPIEAKKEAERELDRIQRISEMSPEYAIIRNYLDYLIDLPWNQKTGHDLSMQQAKAVLDLDHYDLEKVKRRIIEYLAVKNLREMRFSGLNSKVSDSLASKRHKSFKDPVLCFVGPPGVGKTSLGESIAKALGRKFIRISLGGLHDEAEIRGHRRTYVGAMPGKIIQMIRHCGVNDPVFMLDEIDKVHASYQGDPAEALLEVLDPEQNKSYTDNYLGIPFDLSHVLFICTANTTDTVPTSLLDRLEIIDIPSYSAEDKFSIAKTYLLPKQIELNGLFGHELVVEDLALNRIIAEYTKEAGVRQLERQIGAIVRNLATKVMEGETGPFTIAKDDIPGFLHQPIQREDLNERIDRPGIAIGVAWTPVGGDILFVEAAIMPAQKENILLTGMLGDVMRESAAAALTYLRSNANYFGIDETVFEGKTVHIHVPRGAIPKDGPSAGITILAALLSLLKKQILPTDTAMTGEITLRGKVLAVGGIREKALAAYRYGIKNLIMPKQNDHDLDEISSLIKDKINFIPVDSAEDFTVALFRKKFEHITAS